MWTALALLPQLQRLTIVEYQIVRLTEQVESPRTPKLSGYAPLQPKDPDRRHTACGGIVLPPASPSCRAGIARRTNPGSGATSRFRSDPENYSLQRSTARESTAVHTWMFHVKRLLDTSRRLDRCW